MKKITPIYFLMMFFLVIQLTSCKKDDVEDDYNSISNLDLDKKTNLVIAIPNETDKGLNTIANLFMRRYPNVNVSLKYVENYDTNATLQLKENTVDIILKKNVKYVQETKKNELGQDEIVSTADDFYYNFAEDTEIDFSNTTENVMGNYRVTKTNGTSALYCVPLGGEIRGLFVNVTFLKHYNLSVPKNYDELVDCCEVIKNDGYFPIQGNPSYAGVCLGLGEFVNDVVDDSVSLDKFQNSKDGVSSLFVEPAQKIYDLCTNYYYDYKTMEEQGDTEYGLEYNASRSFLGLKTSDTYDTIKPENNYGYCAFWPYLSSSAEYVQDLIDEYDLSTEFEFILPPLNDSDENSKIYFTPYYGFSAGVNSDNLIWAREFVNFFFHGNNSKTYASYNEVIPNSSDALDFMANKYGVNKDTDCTLCGEILFRNDYNGFTPLQTSIVSLSKCNAKKYMIDLNKNSNGEIVYKIDDEGKEYLNIYGSSTKILKKYVGQEDTTKPGYAFCTLQYFIDKFETEILKYKL